MLRIGRLCAVSLGLWVALPSMPASAQEAPAQPATAALRLPRLFQDGMVVQRGAAIPVWGWAPPRAEVVARFGGRSARAIADSSGRFRLTLPAASAGGPFMLSVTAGRARVDVRDVLVGDVWVASGQSNMEMTVAASANARAEIAAARDSMIRQFKVPVSWSEHPEQDLAGGSWAPADSKHVGEFSAVAYYFARDVRKAQRVPIGIINSSWGGSAIETWLSAETQALGAGGAADALARMRAGLDSTRRALATKLGGVPERDPGLVDGRARWADPALDDASWRTIRVPALWETQGYAGMDGVVWYRTSFTLDASDAARGATLALGPIDDDDVTWVNGVEVGRTRGYNVERRYAVPASALRAGANVLAVRVSDGGGGGGPYAPTDSVYLLVNGARRALAGQWRFRVGEVAAGMDGQRLNKVPAITYNRMVHPLLPVPIKGVLWYQGESNANDVEQARAYRAQFRQLVTSWRRAWTGGRSGDFPFLWVQLPNFGAADPAPAERPAWAVHRESMTGALALPHTGQAIAIDVGEAEDIHPKNKQEVGRRLALVARRVAYGERVDDAGPTYRSHEVKGDSIIVRFAHAEEGLVARGSADARDAANAAGAFTIAGADRRFVRANVRIERDRVIVWSGQVRRPAAVRYAWANNPFAVLFDAHGLPAAPFRTDAW